MRERTQVRSFSWTLSPEPVCGCSKPGCGCEKHQKPCFSPILGRVPYSITTHPMASIPSLDRIFGRIQIVPKQIWPGGHLCDHVPAKRLILVRFCFNRRYIGPSYTLLWTANISLYLFGEEYRRKQCVQGPYNRCVHFDTLPWSVYWLTLLGTVIFIIAVHICIILHSIRPIGCDMPKL